MLEPTTSLRASLDCPTSQRLMLHHLPVLVKAVKAKNVNQSVAYAREGGVGHRTNFLRGSFSYL